MIYSYCKRVFPVITSITVIILFISFQSVGAEDTNIASVGLTTDGIVFKLNADNRGAMLSVSGAGNAYFNKWFEPGVSPSFTLMDNFGERFPDGTCTYELNILPVLSADVQKIYHEYRSLEGTGNAVSFTPDRSNSNNTLSGTFHIKGGRITASSTTAVQSKTDHDFIEGMVEDYVINDDLIVDGSECLGFDCYNGYSFGFDTLVLMENNLRILFDDTSTLQQYPRNDWRIVINDSTDGGANYFEIMDVTNSKHIFHLEADAPSNALYVEDSGDVGLGTSTPYYELHIVDGDTPTIRLDQDGSYGWSPQKWDLSGNESNFFIRDATNGSKLPFRIQPGTPSSTLSLKSDGKVGIGTWSPAYPLEVETTGENARIIAQRTSGAEGGITATDAHLMVSTITDHPLKLGTAGNWRMQLDTDNSLTMKSNATCTSGGVWTSVSSRESKTDIRNLSIGEAMETLEGLTPVKFFYKAEMDEEYLGFIAEDVPELVATKDRKHMVEMDIVAVLTKVAQEQQQLIQEQQQILEQFQNRLEQLEKLLLNNNMAMTQYSNSSKK